MNWLIVGLVIVAVAVYVAWPLRRGSRAVEEENESIEYSMSEAIAPTDARAALQQLEFDRSMGKIGDDEYRDLRAKLETHLPLSATETAPAATTATLPEPTDADLEAEILSARARRRRNRESQTETPHETPDAAWTCGECGREMSGADRFCASCGAARVARVAQTAISSS